MTEQPRRRTPSAMTEAAKKRARWIGIATSFVVAATPGVYSAWQSAKTAWKQRVESRKADTQEEALAKNVEALKAEISALEKSCVSQKDLVDLVIKLKAVAAPQTPRRSDRPAMARTRTEIQSKIDDLRKRVEAAEAARAKATAKTKAAPKLKRPAAVRRMIQADFDRKK